MSNKFFLKLLILIFGLSFLGFFGVSAQTPDPNDLVVNFNPDPMFSAINFLPGGTVSASALVTNNSNTSQRIAVEAINVSDPDWLGVVLNLEIKEGAETHYNDALSEFFNEGEEFLSNLAGGGAQTQYDFIVTFFSGTQNIFQGKSLNFDILIGFQGEEGGILPGVGGGGGGFLPPGLTIYNQAEETVATTSVTIIWQTNYFSTSQVIYAAEGESHILDLMDNKDTPPKYGYAHTTPEYDDDPKVTTHSVTITGLTPGVTYYYRTVSHASPPTISKEHSFTTLGMAPAEEEIPGEEVEEEVEEEVPPEEVSEEEEVVSEVTPEEEIEGEVEEEIKPEQEIEEVVEEGRVTFGANMLAAIGSIMSSKFLFGFSIFLLVVLAILLLKEGRLRYLTIKRKRARRETAKKEFHPF